MKPVHFQDECVHVDSAQVHFQEECVHVDSAQKSSHLGRPTNVSEGPTFLSYTCTAKLDFQLSNLPQAFIGRARSYGRPSTQVDVAFKLALT